MNGTKDNRLSRIYREGAWPEPSRQIDAAILSASRRAAREQHSFVKRWAPSFAIAATVVLTSTLVLKVFREQPEIVSPSASDKETGIRAMRAPPAGETKAEETKPAPAPAAQPAPTPQGFSSTMDAAEAERLGRLQRDLDLKHSPPPSESPLPAPRPAPAEKAPALKKEAAEPLQRRPDAPQTPRAQEQPANAPMSVFGATAPAPQPPPRTAAKPALQLPPGKETAAARAAPALPQAAEAQRLEAPSPPAGAAAISGGLSTNALAVSRAASKSERTPQAWIEDIRKLMKEGKSEEAGGELAEFKKRYPDYVLPEDLR